MISRILFTSFLLCGLCSDADAEVNDLFQAILAKNVREVRRLIALGADPDTILDGSGRTPLYYAVTENFSGIIRALLEAGANRLSVDQDGQTILDLADSSNRLNPYFFLLVRNGLPNHQLIIWNGTGDLEVNLATNAATSVSVRSIEGKIVYSETREDGKVWDVAYPWNGVTSDGEIIPSGVYYFEAKTDNSISRTACTIVRTQGDSLALIVAVESGRLDLVEELLSREDGMNINVKGAKGQTPLMQAAMMGDIAMAHLLLNYGADVYAQDFEGWTALGYAVRSGNQELVALIKSRMEALRIRR